jgi:hypothetical protein
VEGDNGLLGDTIKAAVVHSEAQRTVLLFDGWEKDWGLAEDWEERMHSLARFSSRKLRRANRGTRDRLLEVPATEWLLCRPLDA